MVEASESSTDTVGPSVYMHMKVDGVYVKAMVD